MTTLTYLAETIKERVTFREAWTELYKILLL
jgi:hypothetical protein